MGYSKGRKLTEEVVRQIAEKYTTLTDWYAFDASSCRAAKRLGIFEELKSNKLFKGDSTPQRMVEYLFNNILNSEGKYNDRTVIPPFEIDVFYPTLNFGIEYDGYAFHKGRYYNSDREQRKTSLIEQNDELCIIYIKEDRYYKREEYEMFIKQEVKRNLPILNKWTGYNISNTDIDNFIFKDMDSIVPFSWEKVRNIIDLYENGADFRKHNLSLYHTIINKNRRDILEYIKQRTIQYHKNKVDHKYTKLLEYVKLNYSTYSDFYNDISIYKKCNYSKKGLIQIIKVYFLEKEKNNFEDYLKTLLLSYKTYREVLKKYDVYYYIKKLGKTQETKFAFFEKNKHSNPVQFMSILDVDRLAEFIKREFKNYDQSKQFRIKTFLKKRNLSHLIET